MNYLPNVDVETLKNLNLLVGCFFFAFTGSYLRELNKIYSGRQRDTKIHKVVIGTIVGMGLYLIMVYKFIHDLNITVSVALNVICGSFGYEIFTRCGSLEDLKQASSDLGTILKNISVIGMLLEKLFGSDQNNDDKDHHEHKDSNPKK